MNSVFRTTAARLNDRGALTDFLLGIPNGDRLAPLLVEGTPVSTRAYEDETETARFVSSDGHTVKCFSVTGITIDQAEMIAAVADDFHSLGEAEFGELVSAALGPTL